MSSSSAPRPGAAVRGSTTGRPLMAALDLLGRRWALRILWELRHGPLGARALRTRCDDMSPSVLYARLAELSAAGLIVRDATGAYVLSPHGRSLERALRPLDAWSQRWAAAVQIRCQPDPDAGRGRRAAGKPDAAQWGRERSRST